MALNELYARRGVRVDPEHHDEDEVAAKEGSWDVEAAALMGSG
ncbi:hypothetical protein [Dactylosporangium sp. NPDC005555]